MIYIHTTSLHFNSSFSHLLLLRLYIYLPITPSFYLMSNTHYTQTKNDVIYLQSFDNIYLALTLLFHLILTRMSWLQPMKGGLHFILNDNSNYYFDAKVERCEFVGFVNGVIDFECLGCVFVFRIKEKEKATFYINFYSIIFLQSFFFFFFSLLQLNNYNEYMCTIYNCYFL